MILEWVSMSSDKEVTVCSVYFLNICSPFLIATDNIQRIRNYNNPDLLFIYTPHKQYKLYNKVCETLLTIKNCYQLKLPENNDIQWCQLIQFLLNPHKQVKLEVVSIYNTNACRYMTTDDILQNLYVIRISIISTTITVYYLTRHGHLIETRIKYKRLQPKLDLIYYLLKYENCIDTILKKQHILT